MDNVAQVQRLVAVGGGARLGSGGGSRSHPILAPCVRVRPPPQKNPKNGRFQAVPIEDAHAQLIKLWTVAYEALSKPPEVKSLPLSTLLPGGEDQMAEAWNKYKIPVPALDHNLSMAISTSVVPPPKMSMSASTSASTASHGEFGGSFVGAEMQGQPSFASKPSILQGRDSPSKSTPLASVPEVVSEASLLPTVAEDDADADVSRSGGKTKSKGLFSWVRRRSSKKA